MNKLAAAALILNTFCFAQNQNQDIEKPIRNLFLGMKNADADMIKSAFTETAVLQTITRDGTVKTEEIKDFISSVVSIPKGSIDERIEIEAIHSDGILASVFTPYSFYYREKFTHCGTNSFQLVKQKDNTWKIQYLIDTRRKDNCKEAK
ncbi:MAG: nuclear transport factor 2 family protein [Chryseobacterium sp.]|jgi:hypothetical protein|uniref:nuclear transport factor 2 family protein n=1 Tax=Chryseobacterium sp. TaxID=1871047 RepID=UPI0028294740|nr:nuclear transport factor 2 family protein [Chryseobacterium sp.]MDR2238188.1 nuclear transport factor 2 family protein [Chryseobacterium sp.]